MSQTILKNPKLVKFLKEKGITKADISNAALVTENKNRYLEAPVSIREFIESPYYLGDRSTAYPNVVDTLEKIADGDYHECVLTGGIGVAKTTIALYSTLYQLYCLSCFKNPHKEYGLDPTSDIVFVLQSLNKDKAKDVDFRRFRAMVEKSYYFQTFFPHKKDIESKLIFHNNIIVKPISGDVSGSIGENVISAILDEVNFMQVVEKSRQTHDNTIYDQAWTLYNSIARRRESRFMKKGKLPGMICLVSSKRYKGEFTDVKIAEANTNPHIFVYDEVIWNVKPKGTFSEDMFEVFIGTDSENPFIIEEDDETDYNPEHIREIPIDFEKQFETDILNALREIAGVSVRSVNPFILDTSCIASSFHTEQTILSRVSVEFSKQKIGISPELFKERDLPRFVHIDIGLVKDHLGIACGYVPKFVEIERGGGLIEQLPYVEIDFAIDVIPPKNDEIDLGRIRALLFKLKELGLNIRWITLDQFNSADMIQRFRKQGFKSGVQSVDRKPDPYLALKYGLMDKRVSIPYHPRIDKELLNLEYNAEKDKVDHPPNGSKDIADCLAGVVYGICRQRHIWIHHGISISSMNDYAKKFQPDEKQIDEESYMDALRKVLNKA